MIKFRNWICNTISMATIVVPRRWWNQSIRKDDNKQTGKKKDWNLCVCVCQEDQPWANICANSPLFAEEDWLWAKIYCHSSSFFPESPNRELYVIFAHPSSCCMWDAASAWPEKRCIRVHLGSEPGPSVMDRTHLTTKPRCWPKTEIFKERIFTAILQKTTGKRSWSERQSVS